MLQQSIEHTHDSEEGGRRKGWVGHLGRVHDEGHADLAVEVGAEVDGGQFVELRLHIRVHIDQFCVAAATPTLAIESLGDGHHRRHGHLRLLQVAQHLQAAAQTFAISMQVGLIGHDGDQEDLCRYLVARFPGFPHTSLAKMKCRYSKMLRGTETPSAVDKRSQGCYCSRQCAVRMMWYEEGYMQR